MRYKKLLTIIILFLIFTTFFNFNTVAFEPINNEKNSFNEATNSDCNGYLIQLNEDSVFSFINNLKTTAKNLFSNLNNKIINSSFSKEVLEYKEKLKSTHRTIKGDILKIIHSNNDKNGLFEREYYDLFNGFLIKKISMDLILKIKNLPFVKDVYPDKKIYVTLDQSIPLINADDVWKLEDSIGKKVTGEGITIAFLDTGVDYNHIDLKDNYISDGSYDFVNNDSDPMDDNGHGTHITGIAVGKGIESNYQYVGAAPDASFYSFKILNNMGEGNFSTYYDAMMRALDPNSDGDYSDKVDIISLSFGTKEPGNPDDNLCEILDNVVNAGVTVVAAAGNLGPGKNTITSPGCARKSICVGSTNKNDIISLSSSRGPVEWSEGSIEKPDIVAPGVNIKSTRNSGGYELNSGTSMAAPHVSGAVALLLQTNPELNPGEVKLILQDSSKDLGYDINTQGSGRVDILNAINPNDKLIIKSPEIVNETQIFKIEILDNNDKPTRVWTLLLIPFHKPRLKYGHSRRFIAPLVVLKNKEFVKGRIIAFKIRGGFQIVKKDIIIQNKIRVKN
jgi:hypothetical protein